MRKRLTNRSLAAAGFLTAVGLLVSGLGALPASAHERIRHDRAGRKHHDGNPPHQSSGQFTNTVFASGQALTHNGQEPVSNPDDITYLDGHIFVAFQNGVGPQGEPSTTGNTASTIVEFARNGHAVDQWDIVGKCDGLTADPDTHRLIATVNEDADSSLYVIGPGRGTLVHYSYNKPLPSDGGTDAISIYDGMILISASAPGTTGAGAPQPTYPAVYRVRLDSATRTATVRPLFYDEATAVVANRDSAQYGKTVSLALTDPDSNEDVPSFARRFAGDFMLTSQGDQQQIFVRGAGTRHQGLSVLNLSSSVDDTAWPSDRSGAILTTDNSNNTVDEIRGPFQPGEVFVAATPCDANDAPSTCPGPGFPANFLGQLNPYTGAITPVSVAGPTFEPQGMLFVP